MAPIFRLGIELQDSPGSWEVILFIEKPFGLEPEVERIVEHELRKTHRDDNFSAQSVMLSAITPQFHRQNKGLDP